MDLATSLLVALFLGATLGFFGGLFGIGGGIIAIPVLVLGFGMDQAMAQGTALAMMVPNLVLAWWRYAQRNPAGLGRGTVAVAVVATATTWAGASLAHNLDQHLLRQVFAGFLAVLGLGQFRVPAEASTRKPAPPRFLPLVGLVGGGSMGLLGVGGGLVATPLLTGVFGMGQRLAQSVALALVTPSAAAALASYARYSNVDWPVGGALALGGVATVSAGVAVAHFFAERTLRKAFGGALLAIAVLLALK